MHKVLMFPADYRKRIGMYLISTYNKFFGINLCVLKSNLACLYYRMRILSNGESNQSGLN